MISLKEFLKIFRDTGFEQTALRHFYQSVRKTAVLLQLGKRSLTEIFRLEDEYQWPILQKIDDSGLPMYEGADEALLEAFIKSIQKERTLRAHKKHMEGVRYWSMLREVIEERAELFRSIFNFCQKDDQHCEAIAGRYKRIIDRRTQRRRAAAWGIGLGAGAAAGAAAYWYIGRKKEK